ncbi:type I toxin-antitoxin system SymE family toxin [Gilliamella sp. B3172]|uniref:SymE family type I addiction module toxin n=1 Tax=Gilliamella sp. B3172 TaxID=2818006 RepID=UPI002A07F413|nr:type I toxin-antitoxin system SymE family toxin [Gilliamella sp. B3172]
MYYFRYTVGYISVRHKPKAKEAYIHYSKHPALHLKGNWLEKSGFGSGQPVTITAKKGKLIVQLAMQIADIKNPSFYAGILIICQRF